MITYEDFRDKRMAYAFTKSVSDDPKDQDAARKIRTQMDYDDLKKQIGSKKKPTKAAVAEAKKNEEKSKGRHPRDQKELDRAQAYIKKNPKFGLKEVASYKDFMKDKEQAKARLDKKISDRKQKDKLFVDIKKRGIKFYDKKGSGRIQGGRKVYD